MKTLIATAIAIFVSFLGFNGVGQAQTAAELQGSVDAVDCQSGTLTLDSAGNTETIYASDQTAVAVEESSVPFCTLEGYVGAPVDVWVAPYGSEFIATQIDVTGPVPVLAATQTAIAPMPIAGTVLGTVLISGLLYLVSHDAYGAYYRYPYYGAYYHHYYNARYRSFGGYYPSSAPLILAAEPLVGTVLGIVTVNNYQYLAVRDHDGQYQRYPYYGPYRSYYYHPTYRSYTGTYANVYTRAPVAMGDPHWDAPRYQMQQIARTVTSRPTPWSAPHRALPALQAQPRPAVQQWQQARPTYQRPQPQQTQPRPQWQQQAQPTYQRPQPQQTQPRPQWQQQAQPTYQRPQPQQQQAQPTYQRPQPQPQAQPQRGNGGGQGQQQQQQCDPRSNQGCNTPER